MYSKVPLLLTQEGYWKPSQPKPRSPLDHTCSCLCKFFLSSSHILQETGGRQTTDSTLASGNNFRKSPSFLKKKPTLSFTKSKHSISTYSLLWHWDWVLLTQLQYNEQHSVGYTEYKIWYHCYLLHSLMQIQEMCCKISYCCACLTQTKTVPVIFPLVLPLACNPLITGNCTGNSVRHWNSSMLFWKL